MAGAAYESLEHDVTGTTQQSPPPQQTRQYGWVRHLLPRIVIGALIAAALVGVYAVVIGRFDETCWRLIGTIALLVFFSLVSWYDADVSARRAPWFGVVSVVTSAYLLMAGLAKIWIHTPYDPYDAYRPWWEPFAWFLLVAVTRLGLLHIHLVLNTQRRFTGPVMSKVTVVTLVLVGVLTLGLSLPLALPSVDFGETYWRLLAVVAILDALGTILIPLTYTLFGPKAPRRQPPAWQQGQPQPPQQFQAQPQQPAAFNQAAAFTQPAAFSPPPAAFAPVPPAGVAPTAPTAPAASTSSPALPPLAAYPRLDAASGLRLEWPRYISGQPLPAKPDGTPDFSGVVGY